MASRRPSVFPTRWPGFPSRGWSAARSGARSRPRNRLPTRSAWPSTSTTGWPSTTATSSTTRRSRRPRRKICSGSIDGHLPGGVDEDAFIARVKAGVDDIVTAAAHEDTVALFSHGGVINALVHDIMRTKRLLCVQVDYAGITRLLKSRTGKLGVAGVNSD